jgi:hypothetical protein
MATWMRARLGDLALRACVGAGKMRWTTCVVAGGAAGGAIGRLSDAGVMEWTPKGDDRCASCTARPRLVCLALARVAAEGAAIGAAQTVTVPIWLQWTVLEYARFKLSETPPGDLRLEDIID